jgi:hypothetical protein
LYMTSADDVVAQSESNTCSLVYAHLSARTSCFLADYQGRESRLPSQIMQYDSASAVESTSHRYFWPFSQRTSHIINQILNLPAQGWPSSCFLLLANVLIYSSHSACVDLFLSFNSCALLPALSPPSVHSLSCAS